MPSLHEWLFEISTGSEALNFLRMRSDWRWFTGNPIKGLALSLAIGQSDAFVTGFMLPKRILFDRDFIPLDYARLGLYLCVVLLTILYTLRGLLWVYRAKPQGQLRLALGGLFVWFTAYHLLTWWNQPITSDYRVLSLPPLLVLIALGANLPWRRFAFLNRWLPPIYIGLLAINNWILLIYPTTIHSSSIRDAYNYVRDSTTPQDVFVLSEWSVPLPPQFPSENIWRTGAFASTNDNPQATNAGVVLLRQQVDAAIGAGQRVFIYNLIPGRFTLRTMNRYQPDADLFQAGQFEQLQADLLADYQWHPVLKMVDSRNQATYQLGRQRSVLWVICPAGQTRCW
jgi:hypothetical protein